MIAIKKAVAAFFAALAVSPLPAQEPESPPTSRQYHALLLGISAQPGKSAAAAVDEVRRQSDPNNPEAQLNLGRALASFKAYSAAVEVLTRATELAPDNGNAFGLLGSAAFRAEDCDKAIPALETALELLATPQGPGKDAPYLHVYAGRCALRNGDLTSAIEHCRASANLAPSDPRGEFCLGKAYLGSRDFEAALASFTRIALQPDMGAFEIPYRSEAQLLAIVSLSELDRLDQAPLLLKLDPTDWTHERLRRAVDWKKKVAEKNLSPLSWQD